MNISSGRQVWKKHLAQQLDQPVRVVDGLVIICSEKMTALDGNGIVKWTRSLSGTDMFVTETGLMVSDGHIYILDQQTGETKFIYSKEKSVSVYASRNDIFMTKEGNFEKIN